MACLALSTAESQASDWTQFRSDSALQGVAVDAKIPDQPRLIWEIETGDGMASTPVIVGEHVYVGLVSGDLLCLKLSDGKQVWKYQSMPDAKPKDLPPAFMAPIAATDTLIFAGTRRGSFTPSTAPPVRRHGSTKTAASSSADRTCTRTA